MEKVKISEFGTSYIERPEWVPHEENKKAIVERYDEIDRLTEDYLKKVGAVLGVEILEFGHLDSLASVREVALHELKSELPTFLRKVDFNF